MLNLKLLKAKKNIKRELSFNFQLVRQLKKKQFKTLGLSYIKQVNFISQTVFVLTDNNVFKKQNSLSYC